MAGLPMVKPLPTIKSPSTAKKKAALAGFPPKKSGGTKVSKKSKGLKTFGAQPKALPRAPRTFGPRTAGQGAPVARPPGGTFADLPLPKGKLNQGMTGF